MLLLLHIHQQGKQHYGNHYNIMQFNVIAECNHFHWRKTLTMVIISLGMDTQNML